MQRDLADGLRDAEQLAGLGLVAEVQGGPGRAEPARPRRQHEAPDRGEDRPVEPGQHPLRHRRVGAPEVAGDDEERDVLQVLRQVVGAGHDPVGVLPSGRGHGGALLGHVGRVRPGVEPGQPGLELGLVDEEPTPPLDVPARRRLDGHAEALEHQVGRDRAGQVEALAHGSGRGQQAVGRGQVDVPHAPTVTARSILDGEGVSDARRCVRSVSGRPGGRTGRCASRPWPTR